MYRKFMCRILFSAVLSALFISCSGDEDASVSETKTHEEEVLDVLRKDSLLILDIGNSYTNDATAQLSKVVEGCNVDVSTVGIYAALRTYASFKSWYDCYYDRDNEKYSIMKVCGGLPVNVALGEYAAGDGEAFRQLLQQNKWDLIVLHPVSAYAPYYDQWFTDGEGGYLGKLLPLISELQPQALIGFYVVHSFWSGFGSNREHSSFLRWQLVVNSVDNLVQHGLCDIVIPYGTAIENLRLSSLNNDYDLTRDGTHLELGLARYTAACCYYESILAPRYGVSMVGQKIKWDRPQFDSVYPIIDVDGSNAPLAQKAAALAVKDWRHCCNPEAAP